MVIRDVMMKDENELDILKRIKKIRKDMKVVVMREKKKLMKEIRDYEEGDYEYMKKKLDMKEIINIVGREI